MQARCIRGVARAFMPGVQALMRSVFSHMNLHVKMALARNSISDFWRCVFSKRGVYREIPADEKEITRERVLTFKGDAPLQIAGGVHEQGRMAFRKARPISEAVQNLVVTPKGGGWVDGALYERYSAGRPGLRMMLEARTPQRTIPTGYVIQAAHIDTYGDWVSEYLGAVARARPLTAPLLLPAKIARRSYVVRDLEALGVEMISVNKPIKVEAATVLRQQKFFVHFPPEEASRLSALFGANPPEPEPGGVVYYSRAGEKSEVAHRAYPNAVIEKSVLARGGCVIKTAKACSQDYKAAAPQAETVVFDHGSAFYNVLHCSPRRVIEIASDSWWNSAFLMFADAYGVRDYTIIRGDLGDAHVAARLAEALDRPIKT